MADIKVRVGQQNAIKVVSGISGSGGIVFVAENVIGGIASVTSLSVTGSTNLAGNIHVSGLSTFVGVATFNDNVYFNSNIYINGDSYISGISTIEEGLYYLPYYSGGIAYFDDTGLMVSTGGTISSINYTNFILTTDNIGTPTWSSVIDGGEY